MPQVNALRHILLFTAFVASAAASAAPPDPSGNWRVVATDSKTNFGRLIGFADVGTLTRSGNSVSFWLEYRVERAAEGPDGFRGYVTGDCGAYTYSSEGLASLSSARILKLGGTETGKTAAPNTVIRVAIENICAGRFLSSAVDPIAHARSAFGQ